MRVPRPLAASAAAFLLLLTLVGCTTATATSTADDAATPPLSSVTPLADPSSWKGSSSARLGSETLDPVTSGVQKLPVTVVDSQGTTVTITDTSRILALDLYGSLSRAVFELGLGKRVVGRDVSSDFTEIADRPLVTENGHDLNAEAILALNATVIITDTSLGPWDTILQMRDAGVPVVVVDSRRSIDTIGSLIASVADALGVPARGAELTERITARVTAKVTQIASVAPVDAAKRLRMVFLYVRGQAGVYYLFGDGSGADSLIDALGGVDVAKEIGWTGMRPVTDEGIISAAPDLILVMTKGLESVGGVDGLLESIPALAQTPAGANRRVVDMADTEILSFGPDTASVLDALAVAVYAPKAIK